MAVSRSVQYARAAAVFAVLTVIGAICTGVFYGTHHTKRGIAALVATLVVLVIGLVCAVMARSYKRGRIY